MTPFGLVRKTKTNLNEELEGKHFSFTKDLKRTIFDAYIWSGSINTVGNVRVMFLPISETECKLYMDDNGFELFLPRNMKEEEYNNSHAAKVFDEVMRYITKTNLKFNENFDVERIVNRQLV